ncbi:putative ubiquitin carboxyl-terminal hydrolase 50 [Chanos chanos]|uniref:ubiquitinyl hydrolase 1 n=1 Tax=Chanos chanos TaxID=29144 RepID=A0A6J2WY45_CHACN|nr:inactive ubiquitin carboxyl-terminal hydrolase 50 [Chanos chanos]
MEDREKSGPKRTVMDEGQSNGELGTRRVPGICGLINSGNSCYMNAVLQCLCSTIPLVEHFFTPHIRDKLSTRQNEVSGAFLRLLEHVWLAQGGSWPPAEMRLSVCALHPQFNNDSQQDSQELLLFLLNALHDNLSKKRGKKLVLFSDSGQDRTALCLGRESTIVTQLFEGQLSYVTLCMCCEHQTQANQVFTMLSLPIPTDSYKCSLRDCLAVFFQQSTLTNSDQMLCPECGVKRDAAVVTTMLKPPEILVLHLKRFDCQGSVKRKVRANVLFSLESLDLRPYLSKPSTWHSDYFLYGVVNHTGDLDSGHFVAYCHSALTHSWHKFDDAMVTEIQDYLIQSPSAYILFYSRRRFHRPRIPGL